MGTIERQPPVSDDEYPRTQRDDRDTRIEELLRQAVLRSSTRSDGARLNQIEAAVTQLLDAELRRLEREPG
jgi:hypothetical protein